MDFKVTKWQFYVRHQITLISRKTWRKNLKFPHCCTYLRLCFTSNFLIHSISAIPRTIEVTVKATSIKGKTISDSSFFWPSEAIGVPSLFKVVKVNCLTVEPAELWAVILKIYLVLGIRSKTTNFWKRMPFCTKSEGRTLLLTNTQSEDPTEK